MASKICVYKGCNSCYSRVDNREVTIFGFPKDAERAAQWRLLGQVHPKIGVKELFMCSKHFDRKYLSTSKNRTLLVGQAVPNPYKCQEKTVVQKSEQAEEYEDGSMMSEIVPTSSSGNYHIEEPTGSKTTGDASQSFYIDLDDGIEGANILVESSTVAKLNDSKQFEVSIVPPSRKRPHPSLPPPDTSDVVPQEQEQEQLPIDDSEVSIFKVRGEEYVQMSRKYYLREKQEMMAEIRRYKQILKGFKMQLMPLDL